MPRRIDILDEAARDVEIVALVRAGVAPQALTKEYGLSVRRIREIAEKHARDVRITERARRGESYASICEDYGISLQRAREIAVQNGAPVRRAGYMPIGPLEQKLIIDLAATKTVGQIEAETGRSQSAIRSLLKEVGVTAQRAPGAQWPAEHDAILIMMWPKCTARMIGLKLRRSSNAVIGRAHRLGLRQKRRTPRTPRKER